MLERPSWAPKYIDLTKPSAARIYDYLLGGACNSAADRSVAKRMLEVMPQVRDIARLNRSFLRRVVPFLVDAGVRQFLDIGSGIASFGNVHDLAQKLAQDCRVVYVDNDPIAHAHGEVLLRDNEFARTMVADFRDPQEILDSPIVRGLLDFDQPIALLTILMLHYVPDSANPAAVMARYRDALAPGSYLALSQPSAVIHDGVEEIRQIVGHEVDPMTLRTPEQIGAIIEGFEPVEPGIVYVPEWHPDSPLDVGEHPEDTLLYGVVARKA